MTIDYTAIWWILVTGAGFIIAECKSRQDMIWIMFGMIIGILIYDTAKYLIFN